MNLVSVTFTVFSRLYLFFMLQHYFRPPWKDWNVIFLDVFSTAAVITQPSIIWESYLLLTLFGNSNGWPLFPVHSFHLPDERQATRHISIWLGKAEANQTFAFLSLRAVQLIQCNPTWRVHLCEFNLHSVFDFFFQNWLWDFLAIFFSLL